MNEAISVFILAAGLGERLRPITSHLPKPLLPILGRPALQYVFEKVSLLFPCCIGVNLHYKGEVIKEWIASSAWNDKVSLFPEDPLLGTGGALKNAVCLLSQGAFLVHNSDILSDIDLGSLVDAHRSSGNLATLAVHDFPQFNNLSINGRGFLTGVGRRDVPCGEGSSLMAFTGIAVYEPLFLEFFPAGVSSVVDAWVRAAGSGHRIGTWDVTGCNWSDIGTPAAYAAAVFEALSAEGETVHLDVSVRGCDEAELDGRVVVEGGCSLGKGVRLRNCLVLPGTSVVNDSLHENCILGPDYTLTLKETEIFGRPEGGDVFLIGTGGSDRRYYRVRDGINSSVLMEAPGHDEDFRRQIEYTQFLSKYGVPVPELRDVDYDKRQALYEDLGDLSLYSWLRCRRTERQVKPLYERAISIAVTLHTVVTCNVSECPLLREREFDYDHLRWETRYFLEQFVHGLRCLKVETPSALEDEFHRLAVKADAFAKTVIHRDFQSQNIMVTSGGVLRVIDYQGARVGPPAYDVVSLLWDPYYRLETRLREHLLTCYITGREKEGKEEFRESEFRGSLLPCRLQRHMQALGAYAFLSRVKGKRYFLKHAEEGLRLLKEDVEAARDEFPVLCGLVMKL